MCNETVSFLFFLSFYFFSPVENAACEVEIQNLLKNKENLNDSSKIITLEKELSRVQNELLSLREVNKRIEDSKMELEESKISKLRNIFFSIIIQIHFQCHPFNYAQTLIQFFPDMLIFHHNKYYTSFSYLCMKVLCMKFLQVIKILSGVLCKIPGRLMNLNN